MVAAPSSPGVPALTCLVSENEIAPEPLSPSLQSRAKGAAVRLDLDTKISLLCAYCMEQKPEYRSVLYVPHPRTAEKVFFRPGKVLNALVDFFLPAKDGTKKSLSADQEQLINGIEWFKPWLKGISALRSAGPEGQEPDLSEKVRLLSSEYAVGPRPKAGEKRTVARNNGKVYVLDGHRLLEKIAPNWFGNPSKHCALDKAHKKTVEMLPWAGEWIQLGHRRRNVAKIRKVFTKEIKVALLVKHYTTKPGCGSPAEKPSWNDVIPKRLPQEAGGGIWEFRPAWFLDDLIGNWFDNDKPGVVLTTKLKRDLEALPWVLPWIHSVREARTRKKCTALKRQRSQESEFMDEEENKAPRLKSGPTSNDHMKTTFSQKTALLDSESGSDD